MEVLRMISAIQCLVTLPTPEMADGYIRIHGVQNGHAAELWNSRIVWTVFVIYLFTLILLSDLFLCFY